MSTDEPDPQPVAECGNCHLTIYLSNYLTWSTDDRWGWEVYGVAPCCQYEEENDCE